ncbi:hypothetical protein Tco_0008227 [Tanacetum coccineum]
MAPMASSDSEIKNCSKTCQKNNETLKKQYDDLRIELNKSQSNLANYKRGNELEEVKKEKESIDFKIENFDNASKDLDCLLGTQRSVKDKTGLGLNEYTTVPPPPAQVYSPPKNDMSWSGLPEFVDDTVIDYSRPTPSMDVPRDMDAQTQGRHEHDQEFDAEITIVGAKVDDIAAET